MLSLRQCRSRPCDYRCHQSAHTLLREKRHARAHLSLRRSNPKHVKMQNGKRFFLPFSLDRRPT